jgi:hypothetical protein
MIALTAILAQTADEPVTLTAGGGAIMTLSVLLVLSLCAFCFYRILREPTSPEHHPAPRDLDTRDFDG